MKGYLWLHMLLTIAVTVQPFSLRASEFNRQVCILDSREKAYDLGPFLQLYTDSTGNLGIKDVADPETGNAFRLNDEQYINFGFSKNIHWAKFTLFNATDAEEQWLVDLGLSHIDNIQLYEQGADGRFRKREAGDLFPYNQREIEHHNFLFGIRLKPNHGKTYFVRYKTQGNLRLSPVIYSEKSLLEHEQLKNLLFGIYYGILLVMLFYNLVVYLFIKDRSYLHYVLYILAYGLFQLAWNGFGYQYLWSENPWFQKHAIVFFTCIWIVLLIIFTKSFLKTKENTPDAHRVLNILMIGSGIVFVLLFTNLTISMRTAPLLGLFSSGAILVTAFIAWRKGFRPARYFLIAMSFFLLSLITTALVLLKVLPVTFATEYSIQIGSAMEMILLSLALGDRMNILRKEKLKAQQEAVKQLEAKNRLQDNINKELEEKIRERTAEINNQKMIIEEKNKDIMNSIDYAKRIQQSILPDINEIKKAFPDSFIFFKPRDVVSGDFYWYHSFKGKKILAAVDCTGHGVPGAFMAMISNNLLQQIVTEKGITHPPLVLTELNNGIVHSLKQNKDEKYAQDGMDLAFCTIDEGRRQLIYSGASRPLYFFPADNGNKRTFPKDFKPLGEGLAGYEVKGSYTPIGGDFKDREEFHVTEITYEPGDCMYIFSDGYADQFGGKEDKKFMRKRLKKLFETIRHDSMIKQSQSLEEAFYSWMGDNEQVDDVLVIGVRFS